jgi:septum formation protein
VKEESILVLASASPRRVELLQQLGVVFRQLPANIDETQIADETAEDYVQRLAREKARACAAALPDVTGVVLAADTCVVLDQQILGKPLDALDALAMLARLSGREHTVLTAVCVRYGDEELETLSTTRVKFLTLQREQIENYIASGEPFDKAGAYGIQGLAGAFVESLQGSYSGVVGLPLAQTWQLLQQAAVPTLLEREARE